MPLSLHTLTPLQLAAVQQGCAVFGQYPSLLHEIIERRFVAREIVIAVCVALRDRLARVAGLTPIGSRLRKWEIGCLKGDPLIRCTDGRISKVPTSVGGKG